ncbi:MAG: hypothetical protein A3G23_02985 [Bacteroidetes bacterium RIFCSPLOWO2_12_FULL_37_12]|nr:MAG: hypothetical protein A3G23_02985 [Bacteroidetes bacterium RIFCSPLOWO2_12_FULL_37_12]
MPSRRFRNILIHYLAKPVFIALLVTGIIIPFLPDIFDKYKVEFIDCHSIRLSAEQRFVFYNDLDHDGVSEKVLACYGHDPAQQYTYFIIYNHSGGIIKQVNYHTYKPLQLYHTSFGDYNQNKNDEIYSIMQRADSLFLLVFEPLSENNVGDIIAFQFIDTLGKFRKTMTDALQSKIELKDMDNDGFREAVFSLCAGFSLQPRNVYSFNIRKKTWSKSPKAGSASNELIFYNMTEDSTDEIILSTVWAVGNGSQGPYPDESAWLMVLNKNLQFLFEPVEFPLFTSQVSVLPYHHDESNYLAVLYQYGGNEDTIQPALSLYNLKGEKIKEKIISGTVRSCELEIISLSSKKRDKLFLSSGKGVIMQLDENLDTVKQFTIGLDGGFCSDMDADGDGENELFIRSKDEQKLIITRSDFSYPVVVDFTGKGEGALDVMAMTIKKIGDKKQYLSVQKGLNTSLLKYSFNQLYFVKYLIYGGIYLVMYFFILGVQKVGSYKLALDKKHLEKVVTERTAEVVSQKILIEDKQKQITESIVYAKRIQSAILPHRSIIWATLPHSFILYKPKDIVAGDFYWFNHQYDTALIAAADCTGHGVPGALTSMVCSEKLNYAVKQTHIPGEMLALANRLVKETFRHEERTSSIYEGMDIALCSINLKNYLVQYAGANRPLWILRKGTAEIEEFEPTKKTIGGDTEIEQYFATHTVQLKPGDTFYISSDGYADQDGGPKGKRIMRNNFKKILSGIQNLSMKEQKEYLDDYLERWRGEKIQVDDILVIGIRV